VDALGAKLRAGTNCGSCRPELARLLAAHVELAPRTVQAEEPRTGRAIP
jgi:NAD(P)H-nitrite reductase large subunit